MGKVFTSQEIKDRDFPQIGAHKEAASFVLGELFEGGQSACEPRPGINSALVYGSTILSPTRRSDIDILIQYDPEQARMALPYINRILKTARREYRTPIEAKVLYEGALANPLEHNFDPIFMRYLALVQQRHGEWSRHAPIPEEALHPEVNQADLLAIAISYCSRKARRFAQALTEPELFDAQAMQRALELPGVIGRKALVGTSPDHLGAVMSVADKVWTMQKTLGALQVYEDSGETADKMRALNGIDQNYSTLLEETIQDNVSVARYASWVKSNYRPACELAHDVSLRWTEILRGQAFQFAGTQHES